MIDPAIGFFDLTDLAVNAFEKGEGVKDVVKVDVSKEPALILFDYGLPDRSVQEGEEIIGVTPDIRIITIANFINRHVLEQFQPGQYTEELKLGITPYNGRSCLYYHPSEDKKIDFQKLRADIAATKELFREAKNPPYLSGYDPKAHVLVGPAHNEEEAARFEYYLANIMEFRDMEKMPGTRVPSHHGEYFFLYHRVIYASLFWFEKNFKTFQPVNSNDEPGFMPS